MGPGSGGHASDEQVIRAIAEHPEPIIAATDIWEEMGYSDYNSMRRRLNRMVDRGLLHSKAVGGNLVFWPTDSGWCLLANDE